MLSPSNRAVLLQALRPPEGFSLDHALATTFTLDLTALLTAPLAFSLYDALLSREPGKAGTGTVESIDPFALLKAVRGHADELTVFCQAGRIGAPARFQRLFGYLEPCVVQVKAPKEGGLFHPKVWVLRFRESEGERVLYRLLCSSRNLTFDRSWDTLLTLEGALLDRTNGFARNRPLSDFVKALPGFALEKLDPKRRRTVDQMGEELRRVDFELPEGVEEMRFYPLGIDGYRGSPFEDVRMTRLLVVSPFVSKDRLAEMGKSGRGDVLISRVEELQKIPAGVLSAFKEILTLSGTAELEDDDAEADTTAATDQQAALQDGVSSGLHAKVFVADDGRVAHLWMGSANATDAAFDRNVEFMVQLSGRKKSLGVDALLDGPDGNGGMRDLLASFTPPPEPVLETEVEKGLRALLEKARCVLIEGTWVGIVGLEDNGRFLQGLEQRGKALNFPAGVEVTARPIALQKGWNQRITTPVKGRVADYGACSFEAISAFFAFTVTATVDDIAITEEFVLNVALDKPPDNRAGRILQSLLDDPEKVLRFFKILLASDAAESIEVLSEALVRGDGEQARGRSEDGSLLEPLLRALHRDPKKIDAMARIVSELRSTEIGALQLPVGFEDVWKSIVAARGPRREEGKS